MKQILLDSIDWFSVKLNAVCLLGFISGSSLIIGMTVAATATTIIYNGIRIYKELKNKK